MENILDERIRSLARQSELTVPGDYENNIEQLLDRLMAEEKVVPIRRYPRAGRVAVLVVICILFGSGGAYAAFNHGNQRLQQMKSDEIVNFKEDVQGSTAGADYYSRALSASEQKRMAKLTIQYNAEGLFPKGKVLEVASVDDVISDQLCFASSNSTFYLPKRELTNEELLELIDFYNKRDYSIKQNSTQISTEKSTEKLLNESAAVTKAADSIKRIFDVDVSQLEYSVLQADSTTGASQISNTVQFGADGGMTYLITLNNQNDQIVWIHLGYDNNYSDSITSNVESYKNQYTAVKSLLQHFLTNGQTIQSSYLTYSENKENALVKKGVITYFVALSDGSGYELSYSCAGQRVFGIRYISNVQSDQKWNERVAGAGEKGEYIAKVIQLQ